MNAKKHLKKMNKYLLLDLALVHHDPEKEVIVAVDVSENGIGAVLLHKLRDGSTKPIAHVSRMQLAAEKNYSQREKEGLAITFAVKKFHGCISFILQTDHKPLLSIFASKNSLPTYTASRLLRWSIILFNYNFKIQYLPLKKIVHADSLSRLIPQNPELLEETVIAALKEEKEITEIFENNVNELSVTTEDIKKATNMDDYTQKMKKQIW